jgi:hypothetical protein
MIYNQVRWLVKTTPVCDTEQKAEFYVIEMMAQELYTQ